MTRMSHCSVIAEAAKPNPGLEAAVVALANAAAANAKAISDTAQLLSNQSGKILGPGFAVYGDGKK